MSEQSFNIGDRVRIKMSYAQLLRELLIANSNDVSAEFVEEFIKLKGKVLTIEDIETDNIEPDPPIIVVKDSWYPLLPEQIEHVDSLETRAFDYFQNLLNTQGGQ